MNKFIEITDINNNMVSVNVDYIFLVEHGVLQKDVQGTTIKLAVKGYHDYAFQYIETTLPYDAVMNLINS